MSGALKRGGISVRVGIHLTTDGQYAVGVVTQEWQGSVRVDRRLARLRPVLRPWPGPEGVDPVVWQAMCALIGLVTEQAGTGDWPRP